VTPEPVAVRLVLVAYNSGDLLAQCITSARASSARALEVVVVDNGSDDGAPEHAEAALGARLVRSGANVGYGAAANLGAAGATTPWLLVANPDVVFHAGAVDALLATAARWPRAAAVGPLILTDTGLLYPSARELPSLVRGAMHAGLGWWWPANRWTAAYRREREDPSEGTTGWLSGSVMLLRREAFDSVQGFDPGYFMYFEDLDLCERLTAAGWLCVYAPDGVVTHIGAHSTSQESTAMAAAHHASAYRYLAGRYRGPVNAPLRGGLRLGLGARYQLSRLSPKVSAGAQPTRAASQRVETSRSAAPVRPQGGDAGPSGG